MTVISIKQLQFSYGVYGRDFSLEIENWTLDHRAAVFFGPSGCGKSTLLKLIAGDLTAQKGNVYVAGADLSGLSEEERRAHRIQNIGFVFQDHPLVDYLHALENVILPYRINPALRLSEEAKEYAHFLLEELGLKEKVFRLPQALSQGERQRVAIARALVAQPKLLLADEPTAGLDPERSLSVMQLIERLAQERQFSVVVVTHDPLVRTRFEQVLNVGNCLVQGEPS